MQLLSSCLLLGLCTTLVSAKGRKACNVDIKTGPAAGEFKTIGNGTQVYFTGPKNAEIGIIFFTDIFGVEFVNSQLVADSFGAQGYRTIVPDLFRGQPVPVDAPADFDYAAFSAANQPATIDPIIELTLNEIRTNTNIKRLGATGYCFGGRIVARFLGRDAGIIAGYTAHPSGTLPAEWAAVSGPLSIANAELDTTFPLVQARQAEDILRNSSIEWQFSTYSDVPHGFGIRPNVSLPRQVFAQREAFAQAIRWFDEFVKTPNATFGGPSARKTYGEKSFADEHRAVVAPFDE